MKTNHFFYALCAVAAMLTASACKEEIDPVNPEVKPEIKVTGVTTSITFDAEAEAKTFNVKGNYAWKIESDQDWLTVSPDGGEADQVVAVTATPAVNDTRDAREAKITISIAEKEFSKTISVTQLGYEGAAKDTHEPGFVFFQDDFNWIASIWPAKLKDSKYGWTSVKLDGTNYNEFSLKNGYADVDKVFDDKGYTYYADNSTYCRFEGCLKLGRAAKVGYLCTPALSQIDDASIATLAVTFDAALYVATNGNPSANQYIKLAIVGEGVFRSAGTDGYQIGEDSKIITVPVLKEPVWKWVRKQVIVAEADKSTAIQFGVVEDLDARSLIDNIKIERVADNATPAADATQPDPQLDKEIGAADAESYPSAGADGSFTVRINRAWNATVDADWVTFTNTSAGKSGDKYGNEISSDGKSVSICAAGFPYVVSFKVAESKVEQPRTAKVTIYAEDTKQGEITITQEAYVEPIKVDSHSAGYEFINENFNWITAMYDTSKYSYWGWPTVTTNGPASNDQNITKHAGMGDKLAELGWTCVNTETYPRYEGYFRMGRAAYRGQITTPPFSGIDELATATVDVAFNVSTYSSAGPTIDKDNVLPVSVNGPGEIVACGSANATIAEGGKSATITLEDDLDHIFIWNRKHFIVAGATSETTVTFGKTENVSSKRFNIDDVCVSRVADGTTTAAADALVQDPISTEFTLKSTDPVSAEGGDVEAIFRANRAYSVASDAEWLTIKAIAGGTEKGGVAIAEGNRSATVLATGIQYCNTVLSVAQNTVTEAREGHVTVTLAGETTPVVITVAQNAATGTEPVYGEPAILAKWTFTGLYETFTNSGTEYPQASETTAAMIRAWKAKQPVASDVVAGGTISAYTQESGSAFTGGTNTQVMNRMRFNLPSVGDYFLFTLSNVSLTANAKVSFLNGYITGTNASKSAGNWVEEYSVDGGNTWVFVQELNIAKANPTAVADATYMDCEFTIPEAVNGTLLFRVRINSDKTINGSQMTSSNRDIAYIAVDPAIATNSFANRLKIYTGDQDYLVFSAKQIVK